MISIIVPIYKVEKFIYQCVDSIIAQSCKDIEIVLVDDGSPDNCPQICDTYARKDNRVKVVHKPNGGLMSARQAGLKASTGDYIGFVDGDDWVEPDMYEHFSDMIQKYDPDMVMCEFYYSYPDKETPSEQNLEKVYYNKNELVSQIYPTMLFKEPYYRFGVNPCCWSKVYKREIIESVLYDVTPKIKIGEDAAFTYPCLVKANSLCYINKPLYHYRNNPDSMTNIYDQNLENTIFIPVEILKNTFAEYNYNFSNSLDYYILYMTNLVVRNEASPDCRKTGKEKKQTLKKFALNEDVVKAAKSVDGSILPLHTKLVAKFLAKSNAHLLYLYSVLLRRFL